MSAGGTHEHVRVRVHLHRARELSGAMRRNADDLRLAVEAARANGASWQAIAGAVGERPMRPDGASATAMRRFYEGGS